MGIKPMTPSIIQYGTYTTRPLPRQRSGSTPARLSYLRPITKLRTTHLMVHVSS
jgi:hypothetical protein